MTEAVEPGAGAAAGFLQALDGSSTVTRTQGPAGTLVWRSWGDGPALVLLHGGSGSWRHWARNIPHLAAKRRVIAPDLPGLGDSDLPTGPMTRRTVAATLLAALPSLIGDARCDLAGFSYGGGAAGLVAGLAPERVRSLTLIGTGGFGRPANLPTPVRVRGLEGLDRLAAHRTNLHRLMIADPARIDALALEIQDRNTRLARLPRRHDMEEVLLPGGLGGFAGPCGAIWGEHDNFVAGQIGCRIGLLRAHRPDADVRIVPRAGHWVAFEAADIVNRYFEERLDGR